MGYFANKFKSSKNVQRGAVAKSAGDLFENILKSASIKQKINCTRIPDGCKMIRTRGGAVIPKRTTTPFDFLLTFEGMSACIDCKTIADGNFSHSMLTQHQIHSLINIYDTKIPAGYLVWYRENNVVIFFPADRLYHLKARESLKPENGITLGRSENFNLKPILELFKVQS